VLESPTQAADLWAVLGLEPGADAASLKRAFRQQARLWHPDLNGNDPIAEERFKAVNAAYAILSDPARRQAWEQGQGDRGGAPADRFASGFPEFEDYLDALFGRRPSRTGPEGDLDGLDGPGPGFRAEADPAPPGQAPGRGWGVTPSPAPPPPVVASVDAETVVELTPEQALAGDRIELELADGTVLETWTPPLAGDGWRLRLAGVVAGGGDHFLQLRVRTEEGLRIDGLRVLYQLDLAPADAVLGCRVAVPTLEGLVQLRVPAGSSSGRLLRLRGRGLEWGSQRGDQLVEIRVVVPEELSEAEEALYRRLQQLANEPEA
jgi:DnaJ-class molecular chaperone